MKLITDTQLREINETLQDLTKVLEDQAKYQYSYDRDAASQAIARAKNLTLVHNIDALPPAAKNPMWDSMLQLKTNLTAVRDTLISGTVQHTALTDSIRIVETGFRVLTPPAEPIQRFARLDRANQTPVMKIDGLSDEEMLSFQEASKKPETSTAKNSIEERLEKAEKITQSGFMQIGEDTPYRLELPAAKNPDDFDREFEKTQAEILDRNKRITNDIFIPAISNKIPCMSIVLKYFKKVTFLLEHEGQPVADNLLVVRFKWWHSRYRIKALRNVLQVKGYPNTFVDNHLIIEAWKTI